MMENLNSSERQLLQRDGLELDEETLHQDTVDNEQVVASLIEQRQDNEKEPKIKSYAIDPVFQNTAENPYRETTVTVPHLVKRIPSSDLVPKPFRSFNQVLILSYISVLFCVCLGAAANRLAWRAKTRYQPKGLYGLAQRDMKRAVMLIYLSFGIGSLLAILLPVIIICGGQGC